MIILDEKHIEHLKTQIQNNHTEISCGAILGYRNRANSVVHMLLQLKNEKFESRKNGYLISPDQYVEAEKLAEADGLEVLGFYHSSFGTTPTEYDLRLALPGAIYLIAANNPDEKPNISAWLLNETRKYFDEQKIEYIKQEEKYLLHELAIAV